MSTSYTTHVYWGAPVRQAGYDEDPPAWMQTDENGDEEEERDAEQVIAEALGWRDKPYVEEETDPEGHQAWMDNLREKWRLAREFGVELDWSGSLTWPSEERENYIKVNASERREDGASIPLHDLPTPGPEWEEKVRRCASILGLTLVEPLGWYATMSAGWREEGQ